MRTTALLCWRLKRYLSVSRVNTAPLAPVEVFAADELAIVQLMNRTVVRRCFLFGEDPVNWKNDDHRKVWINEQLVHQAKYVGIDLLCLALVDFEESEFTSVLKRVAGR